MRFDDTLQTVLTSDLTQPAACQSAWRQMVDLIGRRRAAPEPEAIARLEEIRNRVPQAARAASARALMYAEPPLELVRMLASDALPVAAPVLASARLAAEEWLTLLPQLTPTTRSVLRNRRDLPQEVVRGLASFGPSDFVLPDESGVAAASAPIEQVERAAVEAADTAPPVPKEPASHPAEDTPFQPLGDIARANPLVREAQRVVAGEPPEEPSGPFKIADVVARIDAYQQRADKRPAAVRPPTEEGFRFETDSAGTIRWVEGVERGPLIGLSLPHGSGGAAQVDGAAAGAFRRRSPFRAARLAIAGTSDAGGEWRMSAVPVFDDYTGRFIGFRGNARRPRRDERAEPQLRSGAAAADSLRQLVHELRTPAGAISSFAEMIEAEMLGPVPSVYRQQANVIRKQARDLLGVIDDLDLAARIEGHALDLRPDRVELAPLLAGIAEDLSPLASLRGSSLSISGGDAVVRGDRRAVERLLARLLATIVSATRSGESVTLHPLETRGGDVLLAFDRPAALDAYPGEAMLAIDEEAADDALLGTGFAMRLARNLARELGGALSLEERRLTLRLPLADDTVIEHAHSS